MPRSAPSRVPWLTAAVALVTAAGLLVQEPVPGTLTALQRSPAATWDEPWRWVTALLVQDGWLAGGVFNIAALVLAGIAVEERVGRGTWAVAYVGTGLAGSLGSGPLRARPWSRRLAVIFCVLVAFVLLASRDLHGGALVTALAASVVAVRVGAIDIL